MFLGLLSIAFFLCLLVAKPGAVSHVDAAGCVSGGVRAYTALHYAAHVCGGETVLVCNGSSVSFSACFGVCFTSE